MIAEPLPLLPLVLHRVPEGLRRALEQEGVPYFAANNAQPQQSVTGRFVLYDGRVGRPSLASGQLAIDIDFLRRGEPIDPFSAVTDTRSALRQWNVGHLRVYEEVARHDKRAIRRRLLRRLQSLIEAAGGIWLRLGAFPYPYASAFNFRLDHDRYIPEDFQRVLSCAAGFEHALSHFVSGKAFDGQHEALARLRHMDVGSHGYWHHTYRDAHENRQNIARGIDALRRGGIEPSGFAAPIGRWTSGLAAVLDELGVSHSSEFALAYDDLPFFPEQASVLQIPVHPVCLGVCLEAADRLEGRAGRPRAAAAVAEHFEQTAAAKLAAGEPLFFYGHPDGRLGQYPYVLSRLLSTVAHSPAVWATSLSDFARWWRVRLATRVTVFSDHGRLRIVATALPSADRVAVEHVQGNQMARVALDADELRLAPGELQYRPMAATAEPASLTCKLPHSLRSRIVHLLDWEKETPLEEIATDHWRGWAKYRLRRLRDAHDRKRRAA